MKKTFKTSIKYIACGALTTSLMVSSCLLMACRSTVKVPDMNISYGAEIGIADGSVDLSGETPIISISAIKAEVGMNIDYLTGVNIANESDFPDLEIWVDASTVDIFTPGNYTAVYTFNYSGKTVSEEVTVTITDTKPEPSASDKNTSNKATSSKEQQTTSKDKGTTSKAPSTSDSEQQTTSKEQNSTTKNQQTSSKEQNTTTKEQNTTTKNQQTTSKNQNTTTKEQQTSSKEQNTTPPATTTKPTPTTSKGQTTSKNQATSDDTTTTREIITSAGNKQTESKYIGNYTIELLSGKTVTIRNTTSKYIVSTRTDISYKERNGLTYKVSKLIITYNTGAEQILETVEERMQ